MNIQNDDNPNYDNSAYGRFGAFINQVNASERRGSLTSVQADDLRTQAEDIRDILIAKLVFKSAGMTMQDNHRKVCTRCGENGHDAIICTFAPRNILAPSS